MIINKIFNNNVAITLNEVGEEIIVTGKGIAYGKKIGDEIDAKQVNKIFEVSLKGKIKKMINMLKAIPIEYMDISDQVIQKAKKELKIQLEDSLYISLTDHIHTSIERYKEGIPLKNTLLFEIKHFYKKEYELGLWTLSLIKDKYNIDLDEDEAGFIALHIVSSEVGRNISDVYEITNFIQEVLQLVENYFNKSFNEDSLTYYRFVTHLKFFGLGLFNRTRFTRNTSPDDYLLEIMKKKYVRPYLCVLEIKELIDQKYQYYLDDEELLFLTIHVAKIIADK